MASSAVRMQATVLGCSHQEAAPMILGAKQSVNYVSLTKLKLQGPCGSTMTMRMGIERRLMHRIPAIEAAEQIMDEETGLALTDENVEAVFAEIRPFLRGAGGGELELVKIDENLVKVRLGGPAASVMTVRVAVTEQLREKIPMIAAVQFL